MRPPQIFSGPLLAGKPGYVTGPCFVLCLKIYPNDGTVAGPAILRNLGLTLSAGPTATLDLSFAICFSIK